MSRMNNQSRSLKIISKQNGWDPDVIQGFGSIEADYNVRETPYQTDGGGPIPGAMSDPTFVGHSPEQGSAPGTPDWAKRSEAHDLQGSDAKRGTHADPYPGMPGAK